MKRCIILVLAALLLLTLTACGATPQPSPPEPTPAETVEPSPPAVPETDISESAEYLNEEITEWTVAELGATIEAAGMFWNDWWFGRGRFAPEHIAAWGEEEVPEHLAAVYLRLLPTSGFESLDDIRSYLLQYYTESWVDAELSGAFAAFVEYDNILYIHIARMCFGDRNWETAEHILIEQDGSHAIIETTVLAWHGEVAAYYESRYRFTFINGRISSTNMAHTQ